MLWAQIFLLTDAAILMLLVLLWREGKRIRYNEKHGHKELKELKSLEQRLDFDLEQVRERLKYYKKHRLIL